MLAETNRMRMLVVLISFMFFSVPLCAEPVTAWNYNGSTVLVWERGSQLAIRVKEPSDHLARNGGQLGSMIFLGERNGNQLSGTAYKFYPGCRPAGFSVQGSMNNGRIVLQGIATELTPSCQVYTTYYDTLQFTMLAASEQPQTAATPQSTPTPATTTYRDAAPAGLASTVDVAYLAFPFLCTMQNGEPILTPSRELYYHQALNYQPATQYNMCPQKDVGLPVCNTLKLTGLTLVSNGGTASATQLTFARNGAQIKDVKLKGDTLLLPNFAFRPAGTVDDYFRAPSGLGLVPIPNSVISADDFRTMYERLPPAVPLPWSFFHMLSNLGPGILILYLPLLGAMGLAFFGFYVNPNSAFAPNNIWYWAISIAALIGLSWALNVGEIIDDAYGINQHNAVQFIKNGNQVAPFSESVAKKAKHARRPETEAEASALATDVALKGYLYLLPLFLFLGIYARYIYAGYHYFFVAHPAQEAISTALNTGELVDVEKFAEAYNKEPALAGEHVSLTETLAQTLNTQALHEKVEADAALAEALMRRDRARAAQKEAEDELRQVRGKLSWWQQLFGA